MNSGRRESRTRNSEPMSRLACDAGHRFMKTILQVEDDPNDAYFFRHAMNRLKAANPVRVVTDGQEAIDYLSGVGKFSDREEFPLPDIVLLDLKLPHVMGLDVLK